MYKYPTGYHMKEGADLFLVTKQGITETNGLKDNKGAFNYMLGRTF